jgi:hypothetical protein
VETSIETINPESVLKTIVYSCGVFFNHYEFKV